MTRAGRGEPQGGKAPISLQSDLAKPVSHVSAFVGQQTGLPLKSLELMKQAGLDLAPGEGRREGVMQIFLSGTPALPTWYWCLLSS